MLRFISKAMEKVHKLPPEQIVQVIHSLADEYDTLVSVLRSINQGVIICDKDMNIIQCNKTADRLLPITSFISAGQKVWTAIDDDSISTWIRDTLVQQKNVSDKEFTVETKQGEKIISLEIIPLVRYSAVTGTVITVIDVTEKRKKEIKLRRAENLASLTNLAATVAHEIKNPLGAISIHIQLIQKCLGNVEGAGKKNIEKYLSVINEEIERLNSIVVDFLYAVRPLDAELKPGDLNTLIKDISGFFKPELDSESVSFDIKLSKDLPEINFDERLLKIALINLLKNSKEALKDRKNGKIVIKTSFDSDAVYLDISDNGSGMDEETLKKIFDPYFTTKAGGSGLGLPLTYKIIKEHDCEIKVNSVPEEGTTFTISFPIPQKNIHLIEAGEKDEIQYSDN